jgi:choline dehydrogenase-like flavoprotein
MTCALSLADSGKRVALLEGGEQEISEWSQSLYQGKIIGDTYFDPTTTRLRYFGGTSNHWGGFCRPLDKIDFEANGSFKIQWPIKKMDLDPYLQAASKILEIPDVPADKLISGSGLKQVYLVFSPPVRFAEKYGKRLVSDARIFLAFDANVIGFETNGTDITGVQIVDSRGNSRRIQANCYVLATGGLENSRLLLWSNAKTNGQVVKNASTLGKYWMVHPTYSLGKAILTGNLAFEVNNKAAGESIGRAFFAPTPATMQEAGVLNCGLVIESQDDLQGLKGDIHDIACVAPQLGRWLLSQLGKRLVCGADLIAGWETEPRPDNRIELSTTEHDALGMPRPKVFWQKSKIDIRTMQTTVMRFGKYLAQSKFGRLRLDPWVLGEGKPPTRVPNYAAAHQMGGTRMATSAEHGIVDSNCKVFGQSNLYVAGSSVFPRSGYAAPTLTIVQLALRLAGHLRATL